MSIDMSDLPKLSFIATLPPIQSAMSVSGNGDGMRIKIDISEDEVGNAVRLMLFANKLFRVTIEPVEEEAKTTIRY